MSRMLVVFRAVTKNWLRSRSGLFFSFLFPVMLLLVFGAVFTNGNRPYGVLVQNLDVNSNGAPTGNSTAFLKALNITNVLVAHIIPPSTNSADYVRTHQSIFGDRTRVLVVPRGFEASLVNGSIRARLNVTYGTLSAYIDSLQNLSPTQVVALGQTLTTLNQAITRLPSMNTTLLFFSEPDDTGGLAVRQIISTVVDSMNYQLVGTHRLVSFSAQNVAVSGLKPVDYYLPGVTAAFIMTNGIIGLTAIATDFKRRGIVKRLAATPLRRVDWIVGNVLSQATLALGLTVFMVAVGVLLFGITVTLNVYSVALVLAGAIMFSGIGMLLAGLVKDPEAANGIGNAIAFPMMFLSGVYFPLDGAPQYIRSISQVLPLTYFSNGLRATMILHDQSTALSDLLILLVLAVGFVALGSLVTKWKEK